MNLPRQLLFPAHGRGSASKRGQTLVIFAFFFFALIGVVGLAADGGIGYFYSVQLEKAVSAAALAGVPYMPGQAAVAKQRAIDEAARNGFTAANSTISFPTAVNGNLIVVLSAKAPTYFMQAFGFVPYSVVRTAEAGYRPPISIGQPNPNLGSTIPALAGGGGNFYFLRFKGWNNDRSEGDAFTPNPASEVPHNGNKGSASNDVHLISQATGNERSTVFSTDQTCSGATPGAYPLPCRGGYNYRIVVPATVAVPDVEIDIYNMAYAPDSGKANDCDNTRNEPTCNTSGYGYNENDSGSASCTDPASCNGVKTGYLATKYSVFNVTNVGLRTTDDLLTQTTVLPIDATNWDCNKGTKGAGNCSTVPVVNPTYMNVNTGVAVAQTYAGTATGAAPTNMLIYHNWADVVNYAGSQDGGLVNHVYTGALGCSASPCNVNGGTSGFGPGTYRVRADALQYDGTIGTIQKGSKGYAIRAIHKGSGLPCNECTVAAWEDICIYSPVGTAGGSTVNSAIPLFELTPEYAGSTINVDIFDVGDGGDDGSGNGTVDVGVLDPTTTPANKLFTAASGLTITNNGINESGLPLAAHVAPQSPNPDPASPSGASPTQAQYTATDYQNYSDSNGNSGPRFQGSWIRIAMPVPSTYAQAVKPNPLDFWSLQYSLTHVTMNDTFTMSVSATGGPVRLISS